MNENLKKGIAIPVYDMVLLPGINTIIRAAATNDILENTLNKGDGNFVAVLQQKQSVVHQLTNDNFYNYGVQIQINRMEKKAGSLYLYVKVGERIKIQESLFEDGLWYLNFIHEAINADLDSQNEKDILDHMKKAVRKSVSHFRGGEEYIKFIDEITDISTLIAYLAPFMTLTSQEKYEFLKFRS